MTDWRDDAACIGRLDLMFCERAEQVPYAKSICARCPSLVPCRQWAIDNEERYGVWGGTTPNERSRTDVYRTRPLSDDRIPIRIPIGILAPRRAS